jgi:prevent-host-death family protein
MTTVGVKALKDKLSNYLRRANRGERVVVTDRGRPLALLSPVEESSELRLANRLVAAGVASWGGGKPVGSKRPPRSRGKTVADAVLEDRR